MENLFTVGGVFREARSIIKGQFWRVVAQTGALILAVIGLSAVFHASMTVLVGFAFVVMTLSYATRGEFSYDDIFEAVTLKKIIYLILASLLVGLAIVAGLILLIIPGLIVLVLLSMAKYAVVDRDISPREALRVSARITKGYRWKDWSVVGWHEEHKVSWPAIRQAFKQAERAGPS